MALAELLFFSNSVGLSTAMNVILPDSGNGPFPVFYLLHGLSDDHTMWCRRTSIERYVAGLPLLVVMPETGRGWYTNAKSHPGRPYEDMMIKDLIPFIDRIFPTKKSRDGRVIGGLSMGGYGAVKLALKYPDLFCSANSHSGAVLGPRLNHPKDRKPRPEAPEFEGIFGKNFLNGPDDPLYLARKCPRSKRPALRLDCGVDDFLIQHNRRFHDDLTKLKFPHEYHEFPGAHSWDYWDLHVQEAIAFHCANLEIQTPK